MFDRNYSSCAYFKIFSAYIQTKKKFISRPSFQLKREEKYMSHEHHPKETRH